MCQVGLIIVWNPALYNWDNTKSSWPLIDNLTTSERLKNIRHFFSTSSIFDWNISTSQNLPGIFLYTIQGIQSNYSKTLRFRYFHRKNLNNSSHTPPTIDLNQNRLYNPPKMKQCENVPSKNFIGKSEIPLQHPTFLLLYFRTRLARLYDKRIRGNETGIPINKVESALFRLHIWECAETGRKRARQYFQQKLQ